MKQHEYTEGPEALEKFKRGMIALFRVPKSAVLKAKKQPKKAASSRKSKRSDKD
jgi:adenine deaminase